MENTVLKLRESVSNLRDCGSGAIVQALNCSIIWRGPWTAAGVKKCPSILSPVAGSPGHGEEDRHRNGLRSSRFHGARRIAITQRPKNRGAIISILCDVAFVTAGNRIGCQKADSIKVCYVTAAVSARNALTRVLQ
ncbi:hypothetical protein EVAR_49464_1 [Eumeta japonica]|uniref:Uncharacterized protein n=1 Tax=Eumeta variegata TaxID=151549 RepID=A0A4C1Y4G8_EUMVA|nr:hypothetical protein EVAR_49464_1 [Eumeta japonica]